MVLEERRREPEEQQNYNKIGVVKELNFETL